MLHILGFILCFISMFFFVDAVILLLDIVGYIIPYANCQHIHVFEDFFRFYYPEFLCDLMF